MPTAYLSPSQLQDLTNVSSTAPGSGDNGKALVWNQAAGRWQAEQVAYSNLSDAPALPIPVASGGTGTQTGSIAGTGALTFASGANGDISLTPNGTGAVVAGGDFTVNVRSQGNAKKGFVVNLPDNQNNSANGFFLRKGEGEFSLRNGTGGTGDFVPFFYALNKPDQAPQLGSLFFEAGFPLTPPSGLTYTNVAQLGVISLIGRSLETSEAIPDNYRHFCVWNTYSDFQSSIPNALLFGILGNGNASLKGTLQIRSTSASTSTTTGALQVAGGIGAQGNLIVGGTRINLANLPTSSTGLAVGDLWRDGENVKIKL